MGVLSDSLQARSIVARLQRAKRTIQELIDRHAPLSVIALARLNEAKLSVEYELLPRRRAA